VYTFFDCHSIGGTEMQLMEILATQTNTSDTSNKNVGMEERQFTVKCLDT